MKLHHFCIVIVIGILGVFAGGASAAERPNILFIAIDDLNDWVEPLGGHPQVKTPAMQKLAEGGVTFTNAHCQSPLCNPSRTSLMTGLRPTTTGVYGLAPWFRTLDEFKDVVTLPQYLQQHGYRTLSAGKIYHGRYGRGKDSGEFDVIGVGGGIGERPEQKIIPPTPGGNHPAMDWGTFPHRDEDKGDYQVASWAVEQLQSLKDSDQPFFLSVGFSLPHVPCYATPKWFELYPEDELIMPPVQANDRADTPEFSWYIHWDLPEPRLSWMKETKTWKPLVHAYLACTSFVDSQVGRVLVALKENGLEDETIIVLWSDHGYHLGEKEISGKNTLWERSTNVPLIFAGPGIPKGVKVSQPAELLDIYPTLVELTGLPAVKHVEGHSLVPQLKDADAPRRFPAITSHNQGNHGIRSQHWRYIRYADGSEELYDMRKDPNEWHNLAGDPQYASVIAEHRQWLPKVDQPLAAGSAARVLEKREDGWYWEGKKINPAEAVK